MKGHVNRCRNYHGREWWNYRTRQYERMNRQAPVVVIVINNGTAQQPAPQEEVKTDAR